MFGGVNGSSRWGSFRRSALALALSGSALLGASGCAGPHGSSVLPAIFGLEEGGESAYRIGKIPDPVVEPGDTIVGLAANKEGKCIYRKANASRRFRADCPEGYKLSPRS